MATTATQIINIVTLNKSTLHWMVSRIVQDSINFYYFWDEYYINAYGITEEKANDSPSNSKSITRILYNRYGNAHTRNYFLLIDRETQTRN